MVVLAEVLLNIAGGFLLFSPTWAGQPSGRQADGPPTEPAQDGPASGGADPAPIFRDAHQSLLEHACNAPIVPAAWLGRPADESVPGFELPSRRTPTGLWDSIL